MAFLSWEWWAVEADIEDALAEVDEEVLQQFIRDGGEPWDIYRTEIAFFGAPLGQEIPTRGRR